jgi:hypothetical protein
MITDQPVPLIVHPGKITLGAVTVDPAVLEQLRHRFEHLVESCDREQTG